MGVITRSLEQPTLVQVKPGAEQGDPEAENVAIIKSGQWLEIKGDDDEHLRAHEAFKMSEHYRTATAQMQYALCGHIAGHEIRRRAAQPGY